jgi:hypothetical protein
MREKQWQLSEEQADGMKKSGLSYLLLVYLAAVLLDRALSCRWQYTQPLIPLITN